MSAGVGVGDVPADAEADDEAIAPGEDLLVAEDEPQAGSTTAISAATQATLLMAVRS